MSPDYSSLHELETCVQSLADATRPAELFRRLLEGARLCAPRAAVFLVRQGEIKGWGCSGYDADTAAAQQAYSAGAEQGWLGALAARAETTVEHRRGAAGDPDFGQPASSESVAIAVRVRNRPIALLMAERSGSDQPWVPAFIGLLVRVAQMRLEMDLLQRKVAGAATAPTPAPAATPAPATPLSDAPAAVAATGLDPAPEPQASPAESQETTAARRFAKLVATDIRLYNEEAVLLGRRNADLGERLGEHLTRGKETFLKRHGALGPSALEILHEAYVQVLAAGNEELLPVTVLD
jgi:hypothetical protein